MGRRRSGAARRPSAGPGGRDRVGRLAITRSGCRAARSRRAVDPASRDAPADTAAPAREEGRRRAAGQVRSCGGSGSVDPANEPADVAGGRSRSEGSISRKLGHPLVPQKSLELTAAAVDAAAHAAHRRSSSGDGRCGGTGHHGDGDLCFLARRHRGMSDRLRGRGFVPNLQSGWERRVLMCLRAGPGAWFGRSNRVVASDWLPSELSPRMAESSNSRWSGVVWSPVKMRSAARCR